MMKPSICGFLLAAFASVLWGQFDSPPKLTSAPSLVEEARKLTTRGHPAEALKQLDGLSGVSPAPRGIYRARGEAFYAEENLPAADASYKEALKQDPQDQEAAQMRGLVLFRMGRPLEAIPLLESSKGSSSQGGMEMKVDPSYVLALCYMDTRRYDDARRAFAAQYGFASESASAYLLAARMLLRREYLPIAEQFARKALDLDPQLPLAYALLGEVALAGQHVETATAEFEKERDRNPLEPSVYDRLGDAYSRAGNYTMAQQSLQRAILLAPNATGPYILLGKVMLKCNDPVGALTYLERAERMDPANFMTHSLLSQAYRALDRTEESAHELSTAQKIQSASEPKLETPR